MFLINLALQCIGLVQKEMSQDMEAEMRKAKSTSDIREAGKKRALEVKPCSVGRTNKESH